MSDGLQLIHQQFFEMLIWCASCSILLAESKIYNQHEKISSYRFFNISLVTLSIQTYEELLYFIFSHFWLKTGKSKQLLHNFENLKQFWSFFTICLRNEIFRGHRQSQKQQMQLSSLSAFFGFSFPTDCEAFAHRHYCMFWLRQPRTNPKQWYSGKHKGKKPF